MNFEHVMELIGKWAGTMRFFPSEPDARIGIAEEIASMAANEDQVRWLVMRLPRHSREWPGMYEVRGLFCTRYKPLDGFEAECRLPGYSAEECERRAAVESLESGTRLLEAGEPAMAPAELEQFHNELFGMLPLRRLERTSHEDAARLEQEIAMYRPTLSEAEKARRIREIEESLTRGLHQQAANEGNEERS